VAAEDINFKGGRQRYTDMDELEQEERERIQKKRLNSKFLAYSKYIEKAAEENKTPLEIDIPMEKLSFFGCAMKSVVKIRPTKNCLVAISEFPFFVLDFDDIQAVHFERIIFGIKNFDMAILYKDCTTFKRINSIHIERMEDLKTFFDEIGVIYSEGQATLNWANVLTEIRENFEDWLEDGGWNFLIEDVDSDAESGEEEESGEDSEAAYGSEFDEDSSSGSDDSSDKGFSNGSDSGSNGLSEEG